MLELGDLHSPQPADSKTRARVRGLAEAAGPRAHPFSQRSPRHIVFFIGARNLSSLKLGSKIGQHFPPKNFAAFGGENPYFVRFQIEIRF